jgi:hypothetical protein
MTAERPYTDADVEMVAKAVHDHACLTTPGAGCSWSEDGLGCDLREFDGFARAVLDALTAPGSPLVARIRAQAGEDVACAIEATEAIDGEVWPHYRYASIARETTRTEEPT